MLLVIAGAYVAWYGVFEIRVLAGQTTSDPLVSRIIAVQPAVSRWLQQNLGAGGVLVIVAALAVVVVGVLLRSRVRARASAGARA